MSRTQCSHQSADCGKSKGKYYDFFKFIYTAQGSSHTFANEHYFFLVYQQNMAFTMAGCWTAA